jgi:two-component system OmpR family response regulator
MSGAPAPTVLVVDDEVQIRRLLRLTLEGAGYRVSEAETGEQGLGAAAASPPDGLVLDLGLPDMDGALVVRRLREWSRTPVLVLSVRDGEEDKIGALEAGADDYLTKPFSFAELVARLNALVRRAQVQPAATKLSYAGVTLDLVSRRVDRNGVAVALQPKELALLEYFLRNPGRVLSKTMILQHIWEYAFDPQTNVVDVLVSRLRSKLDRDFDKPLIKTLRGVGYVLRDD